MNAASMLRAVRGRSGLSRAGRARADRRDWRGYRAAILVTMVATAIGYPLHHGFHAPNDAAPPLLENSNVLMLYLLGVLWVSTRHRRSAAVLASVLCVAAFDACFVPPYLTLAVQSSQYLVTFAVMLLTALTIGSLTHRIRIGAETAQKRELRTRSLLAFSRDLTSANDAEAIFLATRRHADLVLGSTTFLLRKGPDGRPALPEKPRDDDRPALSPQALIAAATAFDKTRPADVASADGAGNPGTFFPLAIHRGSFGVLGVVYSPGDPIPAEEARQVGEAFAAQAALALGRAALADETRLAWERVEAEFIRNTLLSGVSHDLRTPLAAITGSVSALLDAGDAMPLDVRSSMLQTAYTEAQRMERLISNLLEMTRLESGGVTLRREWLPLQEVVGSALHQLKARLTGRQVKVAIDPAVPLLWIDGVAIEQVLTNLLHNALEYTPAGSPVEVYAKASEGAVVITVRDRGPGLPAGLEERVFEKFFRAAVTIGESAQNLRAGIGLGLAICRSIVRAHGGSIAAENRAGGGAEFRFQLARSKDEPVIDSAA